MKTTAKTFVLLFSLLLLSIHLAKADPAVIGQWGPVTPMPIVAMHSVLLDTGKVLFFTRDSSTVQVFDPATGVFTNKPNTRNPNIECAGMAPLADGRILVCGGIPGNAVADLFNPATQTWTALPNMHKARFYPTVTALPDGRMFVTAGDSSGTTNPGDNSTSEIYNPATNTWSLPFAALPVPYYPHMFVLPTNGLLVETGASEYPDVTRTMNVATKTWTTLTAPKVDGASSVMYLPNRIMKMGTARDAIAGPAAATTYVIDMTQPSPAWVRTADMNFRRGTNTQLVTLPDGKVMVFNGGSDTGGRDLTKAILAAEQWSPVTKTWTVMASMVTPRLYHSSALLLPDGRVFNGGTGDNYGIPDFRNYEIYSPPYLFKGARPTITSVPGSAIGYGSNFFVGTPNGASIASVALMAPGAATHGVDMNQRYVPLTFTQTTGGLTVQAPVNANLAPPGHDMLFIVNGSGVPSIAKFVTIAQTTTTPPTITTQPVNKTVTVGQTATFSVVATGNPAPTYKWKKNTVTITGATSASYTTPATVIGDTGSTFLCVATNSAGSATSNSATLTVSNGATTLYSNDMESAITYSGGTLVTTQKHTGLKSEQRPADGVLYASVLGARNFPLPASVSNLTYSIWLTDNNHATQQYRLLVRFRNPGSGAVTGYYFTPWTGAGTTWTKFSGDFTSAANTSIAAGYTELNAIWLQALNSGAYVPYYADDVLVQYQ